MGSRADDKLKEIEALRTSLENKLNAIEERFPLAGWGKKVAGIVAGSSVAGSGLAFFMRRRGGAKRKRKKADKVSAAPAAPIVTVNVIPKGAAWIAAAGVAAWAGMKVYEQIQRKRTDGSENGFRPAVVRERGRQSG